MSFYYDLYCHTDVLPLSQMFDCVFPAVSFSCSRIVLLSRTVTCLTVQQSVAAPARFHLLSCS